MGIEVLLRDMNVTCEEAMMVGDSQVDVLTARNSGIFACGVTYGLGLAGMRVHPPDVMLDSLAELPKQLGNL
jgi:phosphoglycolate phosphatase